MKKKHFFFDIDGTLTDRSTGKIVPSAQKALDLLQENGHFVAIATGRAHYKSIHFMEDVGLHNMVCCGGGGLVINDQLIRNIPLDKEKAIALANEAHEKGYGYLLQLDDSIDVYAPDDLFRQQCGQRKEPTRYFIDPNLDITKVDKILKLYICIPPEEEDNLTLLNTIGHLRFEPEYFIFQYDAKKQGILDMMAEIGGPLEDVVVFGDDTNDVVMTDDRWFSVAMGNAHPAMKQAAKYVTEANVDDGIYNACKKFGWI